MNILEQLKRAASGGKIFSVDFIKRSNGERRHMTCRNKVTKGLVGGQLPYNATAKQLFPVMDMSEYNRLLKAGEDDAVAAKLSRRMISVDSVTHINGERV